MLERFFSIFASKRRSTFSNMESKTEIPSPIPHWWHKIRQQHQNTIKKSAHTQKNGNLMKAISWELIFCGGWRYKCDQMKWKRQFLMARIRKQAKKKKYTKKIGKWGKFQALVTNWSEVAARRWNHLHRKRKINCLNRTISTSNQLDYCIAHGKMCTQSTRKFIWRLNKMWLTLSRINSGLK